ncbi:MAG: 3-hydroxyacyl-CoA dehydrogenase NAD-binding domain-containing protein [Solirubrobacterales bacterium]
MEPNPHEELAVAGSGAIAIGLAALASSGSERVWLLTRSDKSAERARGALESACPRVDGGDAGRIRVTTELSDLVSASLAVEAIVEDHETKVRLLSQLAEAAPDADLATTTSSLSVSSLAEACGQRKRLFGLHVFNPVPVMRLVELCFPDGLEPAVSQRAANWCRSAGKTPVEVPDTAGFVVNRLLFPYLFDAARLQERTGMPAADVDTCLTLGLAHPMGPLALLDLVGLDVAVAISDKLYAESGNPEHRAPESVRSKVAAGDLGQKTGRGFHEYD